MKILTSVVNNPTFIEIQYHTLKKYFKGDYEFIVFNDAKNFPDFTNGNDVTIKKQIEDTCKNLDIKCINIPNNHHKSITMSGRHADTFNKHVLQYQKTHPDKYLLLDSDMFLIDDFDINKYSNYECAIVLQSRHNSIKYFWPGLCYLDFTKIKNTELLNWNCCQDCDSGGMMKNWLKKQTENNIYFIKHLCSCSWNVNELPSNLKDNKKLIEFFQNDPRNQNNKFFCEIYDNKFLHYRAGGNWMNQGMGLHKKLSQALKQILIG